MNGLCDIIKLQFN